VMQLVELIRGIATGDGTFTTARAFVESLGKQTAVSEDFPAFIVNRILLPMINEAIYTLYEGVGTVEAIDKAMRLGANHPMGPLALADLIGLDVLVEIGRRMPAVRFRVFGETDVNDPARATTLIASAPPNVTFEAPVRGAQKAHLIKTAGAYIQPSRWEGQSISVLEALAAGVPCIVSRYVARTLGTELAELTTVIDDDPGTAARQIADALADRPALTAAALRARDIVRDRYSAGTICDELERAYTTAISGREPIGARR